MTSAKNSLLFVLMAFYYPVSGQVSMFRGSPDHVSSLQTVKQIYFVQEAWRYSVAAPIRSTAAAGRNAMYVGASNGILYAFNKKSGTVLWSFNSGASIASSPAFAKGKVYFSNNRQTLYALDANTGKLAWKHDFGKSLPYEWAFDYFYSSPTIAGNALLIGAKDGYVYKFNADNGQVIWQYKTAGIVRSTPAISDGAVYFGDTDGILYALDLAGGKERWTFKTTGNGLINGDFGFDRRALISSPLVRDNKVIIGGRDGFFYAVDKNTGREIWKVDHEVSWVISSLAVQDSLVVTGTSDGRFIQAVSLHSGKQVWKTRTSSIVWSSPVIYNGQVYIGSGEGVLYCLDLLSGRILNRFQTSGSIFSSPVISDSLLYFGSDDGNFYALGNGRPHPAPSQIKRYVFWEPGVSGYFRPGAGEKLRSYLASNGYAVIRSSNLDSVMQLDPQHSVIVFAANYFPKEILNGYDHSPLRHYLDQGGRIVACGLNPVVARYDANKNLNGFNFLMADSILGIHYGPNDLRAHKGLHPAFATDTGRAWGIKKFWVAPLGIDPAQTDLVLGSDEDGLASAWVKKFSAAITGGFIQVWVDQDGNDDLGFVLRVAEYGFD